MTDAQPDACDASIPASAKADNSPSASSSSSKPVVTIPEPAQDSNPTKSNNDTNDQNTASPSQPSQPQPPQPQTEQQLSKRAQKRLAKAAYYQEKKLERRAREKAAKKEKKRALREQRRELDGTRDGEDEGEADGLGEPARKKLRPSATTSADVRPFKARVVVDLGFDSYMMDKEIISLSSQLAYCYSVNRRATCPFESLLFTSLDGRLRARLEAENNAGYKRWTGCEWWEEGYEGLWADSEDPPLPLSNKQEKESPIREELRETVVSGEDEKGKRSRCGKESVIYLTADANEVLEELKEGETYVLGGIVDHNRHKNLCQTKASTQGIRTAQLPIGKYLKELKTRKVLTVNQVFEILVRWVESRDWEDAMYSVMPKRKFVQSGADSGPGSGSGKAAGGGSKPQSVSGQVDQCVLEVEESEVNADAEQGSEDASSDAESDER